MVLSPRLKDWVRCEGDMGPPGEKFWDISWVLADTDKEVDILDRRKNWRSHVPTVEPGDKCTLLGNYQELSGFVRVRPKERERQDEFWQCLRGLRDRLAWYELRPDERLCAISLIKRLFPGSLSKL